MQYWDEPPATMNIASCLYQIAIDADDNLVRSIQNPQLAETAALPLQNWREIRSFRLRIVKDLVVPGTTPTRVEESLKALIINVLEFRYPVLQLCTGTGEHSNWKAWRVIAERMNEQNRGLPKPESNNRKGKKREVRVDE